MSTETPEEIADLAELAEKLGHDVELLMKVVNHTSLPNNKGMPIKERVNDVLNRLKQKVAQLNEENKKKFGPDTTVFGGMKTRRKRRNKNKRNKRKTRK